MTKEQHAQRLQRMGEMMSKKSTMKCGFKSWGLKKACSFMKDDAEKAKCLAWVPVQKKQCLATSVCKKENHLLASKCKFNYDQSKKSMLNDSGKFKPFYSNEKAGQCYTDSLNKLD